MIINKTSLFLVNSPLEMISAIEARKYFNVSSSLLVLFISDRDKKAIDFLLEKSENWNRIIRLSIKSYYGLSWIRLIKKMKKEQFEYFFSMGGSLSSHFLFNLNYKEHYFLDDGTQTLSLSNFYETTLDFSKKVSLFEGKNKYGIKYTVIEKLHNFFGHNLRGTYKEPSFFTFFTLKNIQGQKIVKNNFSWFRSMVSKKKEFVNQDDYIFVIGSALVTDRIISLEYYVKVLNRIKEQYKNQQKELIYIYHRREKESQLKVIERLTNFTIQKNEFLIEIDFFLNKKKPTHIVSTVSTAIFTLKQLYGDILRVDCFSLDENEIVHHKKDHIRAILNYQKDIVNNIY